MSFIGRKFLHASDIHLGFPLGALDGCGQLDSTSRSELIEQMQKAFENLVNLAVDEEVLFVVLAGDIYDGLEQQEALQGLFRRGLEKLHDEDIAVYMVHGNHDPLTAQMKWRRPLPPNVHTFSPDDPHEFLASSGPEGQVWVAGVSFGSSKVPQNLAARFSNLPVEHARWRVGVLHTSLGGNSAHETYAPCSVDDLRAAPVGYWALGHIHMRDDDNSLGHGRWWAYPGNLQGKSFKPAECHPKGALLVEITPDGFGKPEFRPLDTVRFVSIQVPVDDVDAVDDCLPLVIADIDKARDADRELRLVIRVELTGRSSLATAFGAAAHDGENGLLAKFLDDYSSEIGDTVVAAITSAVRPVHDMQELRKGDSLLATTLSRLDAMTNDEILQAAVTLVGASVAEELRKCDGAAEAVRERVVNALVEAIVEGQVNP